VRAVMMAKTAAVIATLNVSVRFVRSPTTAPPGAALDAQKADPSLPKSIDKRTDSAAHDLHAGIAIGLCRRCGRTNDSGTVRPSGFGGGPELPAGIA
jgi:hypothetical protein